MYIEKVKLDNFRNYENGEIEFDNGINIIYGNNAQGKTNIIEAIFLCSMGKSFRDKKDKDLIKFSKNSSKVSLEYNKVDRKCKIEAVIDDKKSFYINGVKQAKVSDIIGKLNVIIFTPEDIDIIKEGPQRRRKFLDMMISSLKPNYIHLLNKYNKAIEQRNSYLRQIKFEGKDRNLLEVWDEQLSEISFEIYKYRKFYIEKFSEKIQDIHNLITKSGKEQIEIKYVSSGTTKEEFFTKLRKSVDIDISRGFTTSGIHRDDFFVYINKKEVSTFGSQGQQRTATLTLKLCELNIVKEEINDAPVLLLDDFMSELDEERRKNFLENITGSQVILTCTDKMQIEKNAKTFFVEKGICKKEK